MYMQSVTSLLVLHPHKKVQAGLKSAHSLELGHVRQPAQLWNPIRNRNHLSCTHAYVFIQWQVRVLLPQQLLSDTDLTFSLVFEV